MRRLEFIGLLAGAALSPVGARAQQKPGSVPVVVYLVPKAPYRSIREIWSSSERASPKTA
jgi:hypothetical protein